jgi:hypothetical protein
VGGVGGHPSPSSTCVIGNDQDMIIESYMIIIYIESFLIWTQMCHVIIYMCNICIKHLCDYKCLHSNFGLFNLQICFVYKNLQTRERHFWYILWNIGDKGTFFGLL